MKVIDTPIEGLKIIEPTVLSDERGYFFESYSAHKLATYIPQLPTWVQDNESQSKKGVLRGLHFQLPPFAQAKLVRVSLGAVQDVVVDLRKGSKSHGKHLSVVLSSENKRQLLIPEGFAHGFLVLEEQSIFTYKCSARYDGPSEGSLRWDDPDLGIVWQMSDPQLSPKDQIAPLLRDFDSPFSL